LRILEQFGEWISLAVGLQDVAMRLAVLSLGLWLAGAQGFAAQACCAQMPSPKAACDGCGDSSDRDTSSRPDCCTSPESQKDIDVAIPRNTLHENPVVIDLLPIDPAFVAWCPETTDLVAQQAAYLAEGPPLYLRNEVLLI
jgi:hypothetical protein